MDWLQLLTKAAAAVGGVATLAVGLLYLLQDKVIYVPRLPGLPSEYPYHPDAFSMAYEDVWLTTADGVRLHAWLMWPQHWGERERRAAPTVMFFQENAGNMAYRLPFLKPLTRFLDCNAFILSYRGYGSSQGVPSERGLQLDAVCAVDYVLSRPDIDSSRLVLFGRSLGGAVAVHAALQRRQHVAGLIIENSFTRIVDAVPHAMPLLGLLVGPGRPGNWLVRNHWNSKERLKQLTDLPTLFLVSIQDEMVPSKLMLELYKLHPTQPWHIVRFEHARHLDAYDREAALYWPAVRDFLASLPRTQAAALEGKQAADGAARDSDATVAPARQAMELD